MNTYCLMVSMVLLPLQILHLGEQVQAGVLMEHISLVFPINFSVFRPLLLNVGVVASIQCERIGGTWRCRYLMFLNNNISAVAGDVDPQVEVSGAVYGEIHLDNIIKNSRYSSLSLLSVRASRNPLQVVLVFVNRFVVHRV